MTTLMHSERLEAVLAALRACDARTILDLGCGDGPLLLRLAQMPQVRRIVGLDCCLESLETLRDRLRGHPQEIRGKVDLVHGSMTDSANALAGFDAAILVETIEHVEPERLAVLERAVFRGMRPAAVIISTPNRDFNPLLGVPPHRFRHPDHRFEWGRDRFRQWATGVAGRHGYAVEFDDVAGCHPTLGGATQLAVFRIRSDPPAAVPHD